MAVIKPGEEGKKYQPKLLDSVLLGMCGSLTITGPYNLIGSGTISCGSTGVGMTLVEEM